MKCSIDKIRNRQKQILEYINQNNTVSTKELAEHFKITTVTVRRDLDYLSGHGKIIRTFGGATTKNNVPIIDSIMESNYPNEKIKKEIAKKASAFIKNDNIVFINSSTTASYIFNYIADKSVTIVTNNILALKYPRSPISTIILTGGQIQEGRNSMTGQLAINAISKIVADVCILGVRGISASDGITSPVMEEATINKKMIQQTNGPVIVVTESTKIGKKDRFLTASISSITHLITNADTDCEAELNAIRNADIKVIT